jgi:hypothetical protein
MGQATNTTLTPIYRVLFFTKKFISGRYAFQVSLWSLKPRDSSVVLGAFAKQMWKTNSCVMSVRPQGTERLRKDGFSCKFIFDLFLLKCIDTFRFFLKSDRNNRHFTDLRSFVISQWFEFLTETDYVLYDVRTGVEENVILRHIVFSMTYGLEFKKILFWDTLCSLWRKDWSSRKSYSETDCVLCDVRTGVEETLILIKTGCVLYDVRTGVEETLILTETVFSMTYGLELKKLLF